MEVLFQLKFFEINQLKEYRFNKISRRDICDN
jgi:hypothetical protein